MRNTYTPIIGLEVHVEFRTDSKMFCGCPADHFGKKPNIQTCPVCLGLPGALPLPNKKAIEWAIMIGLALKCKVNKSSKFDRKHYFYPDLPKGFQISQYDEPLAIEGWLEIPNPKSQIPKKIRIRRVHIEEDTGKLQHIKLNGENVSLVDFNRSGVPLVEIVTEPDIRSSGEAKEFAKKLQQIIRSLGISDCDMEKGSMRLEANISLQKSKFKNQNSKIQISDQKLPNYKVEVKNINSFRFLEKAIEYEMKRQSELLGRGEKVRQETRGWNEGQGVTMTQRYKETEADYRYFPEPDIPPMEFEKKYIENLRRKLPKLPDEIAGELVRKYKIRKVYAQMISIDGALLIFASKAFEEAKKMKIEPETIASIVINQKLDISTLTPGELVENVKKEKGKRTAEPTLIKAWVEAAIEENKGAVTDYKKGKVNALAALIGAVMRISKGKADPMLTRKILEEKLK